MNRVKKKLKAIAENMPLVYEAGKAEGGDGWYDTFWDSLQKNGTQTFYEQAFSHWGDAMFKPKYNIICTGADGAMATFYKNGITDIKGTLENLGLTMDFSQATKLTNTFYGGKSARLPVIDVSSCDEFTSTFGSPNLVSIDGLLNIKETAKFNNYVVFDCTRLVDIFEITGTIGTTVTFGNAKSLSEATVKRIVNALKTIEDGVARTITFHPNIKAKEWFTDELKATITQTKGWTLG